MREWINTSQLHEGVSALSGVPTPSPTTNVLHKSTTDSTLVSSTCNTPCLTPCHTSPTKFTCLPPPMTSGVEVERQLGRAATTQPVLPDVPDSRPKAKDISNSRISSRANLVRLFSSEDDMDDIFDGRLPSLSRQTSSTSQFDEYFIDDDDTNLDSFSMLLQKAYEEPISDAEPPTPTNKRNMLFKVLKETGFHQHGNSSPQQLQLDASDQTCKEVKGVPNSPLSPVNIEDQFRPRNLSIGKQSSRCSTPQTIMCG